MTTPDVHRPYLALLLAVLDHDDHRSHAVIAGTDPAELAHYAAHKMVASIDTEDHAEMRADLEAELLDPDDGNDTVTTRPPVIELTVEVLGPDGPPVPCDVPGCPAHASWVMRKPARTAGCNRHAGSIGILVASTVDDYHEGRYREEHCAHCAAPIDECEC